MEGERTMADRFDVVAVGVSSKVRRKRAVRRPAVLARAAGMVAASLMCWQPAVAEEGNFLTGETLELLSDASAGSGDSLVMQEWGHAIERLVPGVTVVVRTNPGGTEALTAAMLADAAPDGLTIGTGKMSSLLARHFGQEIVDISQFRVVGGLVRTYSVVFASVDSGIGSIEDLVARNEPTLMPVGSTLSTAYLKGYALNALLGTRVQPVTGYSSGERLLAFQSGETPLFMPGYSSSRSVIDEGIGRSLVNFTDVDLPAYFGDVPSLSELGVAPEFQWLVEYFNAASTGRYLLAPKDTPDDRLEVLRDLLMKTATDAEFVAVAERFGAVDPIRGDLVEAQIAEILRVPGSLEANVSRAMECGMQVAETGARCAP